MTHPGSRRERRSAGLTNVDFAFIVACIAAVVWLVTDFVRPPPPSVPSREKASGSRAVPVVPRPAGAPLPAAPLGSFGPVPGMPPPTDNASKSHPGSLAIDPFAEGGPAVIAVHPEPPAITGPIEERDEEVLKGNGQ